MIGVVPLYADTLSPPYGSATRRPPSVRDPVPDPRETLEGPGHPRDDGPVIAGQDWGDGPGLMNSLRLGVPPAAALPSPAAS